MFPLVFKRNSLALHSFYSNGSTTTFWPVSKLLPLLSLNLPVNISSLQGWVILQWALGRLTFYFPAIHYSFHSPMLTYPPKKTPDRWPFAAPANLSSEITDINVTLEIKGSDIPCEIKSPHPVYPWFMKVIGTNACPRRNNEGKALPFVQRRRAESDKWRRVRSELRRPAVATLHGAVRRGGSLRDYLGDLLRLCQKSPAISGARRGDCSAPRRGSSSPSHPFREQCRA